MRYDIVIVSYNSGIWLPGCIGALAKLQYDLSQLHVIVVDNGSAPDCVRQLRQLQAEYTCFGAFTVHEAGKNMGFGRGCNKGASLGDAPYVFMLNVDTEIEPDALTELDKAIAAADETAGAFELRQKPWETGHHHDPVTMETDWNSGACVVYPRPVFEKVQGFDENIFLYCEDVDISWRIRAHGYRLLYVPRAAVFHYTRRRQESEQKKCREYIWTAYTRLLLRHKYGGLRERLCAIKEYLQVLRHPVHFPHVRRLLAVNFMRFFLEVPKFLAWRCSHRDILNRVPVNWKDDGYTKMRGLYTCRPLREEPLVSLIVRTCNNGDMLRLTLQSLRHQTYRNYEIVLQEDGPDTVSAMLAEEFADLPIRYEANGVQLGRSRTGNRALERARGSYINFLDSDDFFYPEHIELMVATFQQHPDADIVLNGFAQYNTNIRSTAPYVFDRVSMGCSEPSPLKLSLLCRYDPIPILSAMFRRELYEKKGGLREDIDANEDWAMWLRFFTNPIKVYANPRVTCAFVFPADPEELDRKLKSYAVYHDAVYEDPALVWNLTAAQLRDVNEDMKIMLYPFDDVPEEYYRG